MEKANSQHGLRRYAGGGLIGKLFGPAETVTEKYARQDAEFKAKHPERFQEKPAEAPKQSGLTAISDYSGMNSTKVREKAAGLKAGGMVKKCVTGGKIAGPGGPTDDQIPIMASNGEFMIKASSAKILGEDVLEALNDLGDEPKNPKDDAAEDAKEGESEQMKCGGMVRKPKKMAGGGWTSENQAELDKRVSQIPSGGIAPAPDGLSNGNNLTRNVNNSLNALGGMGVVASVPLKAAAAVPSGLGAIKNSVNATPLLANAAPGADFISGISGVAKVGGANLPTVIPQALPVAKTVNVALQEGAKANQMAAGTRSLGNASAGLGMMDKQQIPPQIPVQAPAASPIQPKAIAQQAAPNGIVSASPTAPQQVAAPAAPSSNGPSLNAPWYTRAYAGAANMSDQNGLELERARRANVNPGDANDPLKTMLQNGTLGATSPTVVSPAAITTQEAPAASPYADPSRRLDVNYGAPATPTAAPAAPADEFSNAAIATRNPGGMVRKVVGPDGRTTYSGSNVTGEVSFQSANGNALPGRPGGGYLSTDTSAGYAEDKRLGDQMQSDRLAKEAAGLAAQKEQTAANFAQDARFRASLNNPVQNENSRIDELVRKGMSVRSAANLVANRSTATEGVNARISGDQIQAETSRRGQDIGAASSANQNAMQDKRYAQSNAIEQEKLGMSRTEHVAKMATQKQLADAQAEYLAAGDDPAKLKAAERKLITLGGKQPTAVRAFAVPGGQGFNSDGTPYTIAASVYDPDTKQFIQQGGSQGQQANNPTTQAEYDKLPKGAQYIKADGKPYIKG